VGIGSLFHVLRSRTRFRRYRGRRVPYSCFALPDSFRWYRGRRVPFSRFLIPDSFSTVPGRQAPYSSFARPDSFSAVPGASGPVFMFCAPGLIFGGTGGVGSRVLVLRARTHFRRFRGRRVPFFYFAPPYSFSAVPRASGPIFMFCTPVIVFGGTVGVGSRFHVFCSRTRFRRY
jgi:hypothetical protein